MRLRHLVVLLLLPTAGARAADSAIEFSAVLVLPAGTSVRLALKSTGNAAWIPVGQGFEGYTISAYDARTETVVLTKDGATTRIRLNTAKVRDGKPAPDPAVVEQQRKAILNNLRQLAAAADQYYLEHGTNHVTLEELVGPSKYVKAINPVDSEDYRQIVFTQGTELRVTTASGLSVNYAP
ncbi:MAG TPA: hypothetical protein VG838_11830 [Opitutaceae bacterium]|nr:hypothetical protein [Opitutaceae bacterium]